MQEQNRKKIFIGAGGLVVLAAIILLSWLYYGKTPTAQPELSPNDKYVAKYREAEEVHHAGKMQEGIDLFNEALKLATTKSQETQTKLKIAHDIFYRGTATDRVDSVAMYKGIIADTSVSPMQRAIAISDLLDLSNGTHDETFERDVVFKGEPFQKYIDEAKSLKYRNDTAYAARRAYESAEALYPLSLSEFRIAGWYYGALDSGLVKNAAQQADLISQLKNWSDKGDANLAAALKLGYETDKIGYIYQVDALAKRAVAKYGNKDYSVAEELFKKGLDAIAPEDEAHTYMLGMYLRFHYAGTLAEVYGDRRKADIETILAPIIAATPTNQKFKEFPNTFFEFLKNEMDSSHDTHAHKQDIESLVKIAPAFKTTVAAWGISF